jgi:hypothetical protein
MTKPATYIKTASGDALLLSLIGSCSHYVDHGVMILNTRGEKLLWISEPDNTLAQSIRDDIVEKLLS